MLAKNKLLNLKFTVLTDILLSGKRPDLLRDFILKRTIFETIVVKDVKGN